MKPNIDIKGRILRAILSLIMLSVTIYGYLIHWPLWICVLFLLGGLFVAFEAARGWCAARACGIKTKF